MFGVRTSAPAYNNACSCQLSYVHGEQPEIHLSKHKLNVFMFSSIVNKEESFFNPFVYTHMLLMLMNEMCDWLQDMGNNKFDNSIHMAALYLMVARPSSRIQGRCSL